MGAFVYTPFSLNCLQVNWGAMSRRRRRCCRRPLTVLVAVNDNGNGVWRRRHGNEKATTAGSDNFFARNS